MLPILVLFLVDFPSIAQGDEPVIQADVYDALYSAKVHCDDNLDQPRSEFITEEIERNGGNRVSIELLAELLTYNVQTAKQSITDKTQERDLYISEILRALKVSSDESVEEAEASKERHERVRQIDDLVKKERRYVEVHECVLSALQKPPPK